jgi:hypothetical protein
MTTAECRHCSNRYPLNHRAGRNGTGRALHKGRRYCSDKYRQAAFKGRRVTIDSTQVAAPSPKLTHDAPRGVSRPLQMAFGGYSVVPDAVASKIYRVRRPDGGLTDMVNLSRARDAARSDAA